MHSFGIWIISLASVACILIRPFKIPEWVWAIGGSTLLMLFGLIKLNDMGHAVLEGVDVYCFLIGMMLLSEQARSEGLFDWLAQFATRHAKGSANRLFFLIYVAGVFVTIFLSNDATAVVMTPAVYAAVKKAGAKPLPYLFACAFIANAASFVLPISNPANLVVYAGHMPKIIEWLNHFALPSLGAIVVTYAILFFAFKKDLTRALNASSSDHPMSDCGKITAWGLFFVVLVMLSASTFGVDLGLPTLMASLLIVSLVAAKKREVPKLVFRHVAWGVIPLVAGLFIIVEALNQVGVKVLIHGYLVRFGELPILLAKVVTAFSVGLLSNLANNLPVGLVSGMAVHHPDITDAVRSSVLIGVDLGPNLSVTGSLATLLWLMVLRREGESVSGWSFFKVGLLAMPAALLASILLT